MVADSDQRATRARFSTMLRSWPTRIAVGRGNAWLPYPAALRGWQVDNKVSGQGTLVLLWHLAPWAAQQLIGRGAVVTTPTRAAADTSQGAGEEAAAATESAVTIGGAV